MPVVTADPHSVTLAVAAARAASDKLAEDIVAIDVSSHLVLTDVFLLCSAANDRAVRAVVDAGRAAPSHVVNLGHGVPPDTDPDVLTRVVELVHSLS